MIFVFSATSCLTEEPSHLFRHSHLRRGPRKEREKRRRGLLFLPPPPLPRPPSVPTAVHPPKEIKKSPLMSSTNKVPDFRSPYTQARWKLGRGGTMRDLQPEGNQKRAMEHHKALIPAAFDRMSLQHGVSRLSRAKQDKGSAKGEIPSDVYNLLIAINALFRSPLC